MTLYPDIELVNEFPLLERADAVVKRMGDHDDEFVLRLRTLGVEWYEGTVDEIFGLQKVRKGMPGVARLPLILQCEDEVRFCFKD